MKEDSFVNRILRKEASFKKKIEGGVDMETLRDILNEFQNLVEYGEGLNGMLYVFADAMEGKSGAVSHSYIMTAMFLSERMQEYQDCLRDIIEKSFAAIQAERAAVKG